MQEYDVALKLLLRGSAKLTMRELTGSRVETWLDIEMSKVQNSRVDLLGETAAEKGRLQTERQSSWPFTHSKNPRDRCTRCPPRT